VSKIVEIPWSGNCKVGDEVETPEGLGLIVKVLPGPQKFHVVVPPPPKKLPPRMIPPGTMLVNPEGKIFGVIQEDGTILERDDGKAGGGPIEEKGQKEEEKVLEGNEEEAIGEDEEEDEGGEGEGTGVLILQPIHDKGEPTGEYVCAKCDHIWKPVKLPKQCPKCRAKEG
jgi:hypothetical protein